MTTPASPSQWVARWASSVPAGGGVLDAACGGGRHARLFLERGYPVTAIDLDLSGIADLEGHPLLEAIGADLEADGLRPLLGRLFAGVVVTNYLWRPLLGELAGVVAPGGVLIYETFARGQERFGKPSNPDFLLEPGELLETVRGRLRVLAYEDVVDAGPRPAAVQRICARREVDPPARRLGQGS